MREKGSTTQQVMRGNLAPYRVPRGGWIDKGIWGCLSSLHSREQAPKFGHYSGGEFGTSGFTKNSTRNLWHAGEWCQSFLQAQVRSVVRVKGTACTSSGEGSTSTCAAQLTAATSPGSFMDSSDVPTTTQCSRCKASYPCKLLQASGFRETLRRSRSADPGMAIPTSGDAQGKVSLRLSPLQHLYL